MTPLWWLSKDGDDACLALYERHYSAYQYRDGRVRRLFCGARSEASSAHVGR